MSTEIEKIRSTARTPDYSGTTSSDWSSPDLEDYGYDSVEDMTADEKSDVASHSLLGSADADTFDELQLFPVVEPSSNNLSENALKAVISGRGSQANISTSTLESAQSKARGLLQDEFDMGEEKKVKKFVSSIFDNLGGNTNWGEFLGLDKSKLATIIGDTYNVKTDDALDILDTMPEIQKEMKKMKKEELIEIVKKVRDGEMEMSKALDEFVDVDDETIKEIKSELDKEKKDKETEKDKDNEDKDVEKIIDEKVEKVMDDEDVSKSKAMEKVLEDDPNLYEKYKMRGV